jgi:hypothetical protein
VANAKGNAFSISKELDVPSWSVTKQLGLLNSNSKTKIDNLLNSLSKLEYEIKNNAINPYNSFILLLTHND